MKIGLVGCVKQKNPDAIEGEYYIAQDIYCSPLFRGRRAWVERTCDRWYILSALHGLLDPAQPIRTYDRSLDEASTRAREKWTEMVVWQLRNRRDWCRQGTIVEIHAGKPYTDHGLIDFLLDLDVRIETPARGLGIGAQLALYKEGPRA